MFFQVYKLVKIIMIIVGDPACSKQHIIDSMKDGDSEHFNV